VVVHVFILTIINKNIMKAISIAVLLAVINLTAAAQKKNNKNRNL